jgi:hypothetical protein
MTQSPEGKAAKASPVNVIETEDTAPSNPDSLTILEEVAA